MRKAVSDEVVADLMIKTRRRCCLCVYLAGDRKRKRLQIAHIDRDHANSAEDNLAPLCLDHHDEYDSRTSQSKGINPHELRRYKEQLINDIAGGKLPIEEREPEAREVVIVSPSFDDPLFYHYGCLFAEVSRILLTIDPVGIDYGQSQDEYAPEAHDIIACLQNAGTGFDLAKACRDVLTRWFAKEIAEEYREYDKLAAEIGLAWGRFLNMRTRLSNPDTPEGGPGEEDADGDPKTAERQERA